jgi:hypothetical protein
MEMLPERDPADFTAERPASDETVKRIRKLRWLGLESEAQQLEKELEHQAAANTVISMHGETD